MANNSKVREQLSQHFLEALNQGILPWTTCWKQLRPANAVTGKRYRGVNALMLSWIGEERGYADPRWCTYKQAQEKGWQVKKGAKAANVEYWAYYDLKAKKLLPWKEVQILVKQDPDYAQKNLLLTCRTHAVFNAEQIDGIPALELPGTDIGSLRQQRDALIRNMGVGYREQGGEAYYSPGSDTVTLPPEMTFEDTYSYMATLFHECGHATGHPTRLNRDLSGRFGSEEYAREELRAEIASAFTAQELGLQLTETQLQFEVNRHTAYIQHWSEVLQKSPDELYKAIKEAEKISDYIIEKSGLGQEQEKLKGSLGKINYEIKIAADGSKALYFTGSGSVPEVDPLPWQIAAAQITQIHIANEITHITAKTLQELPALEKISIPAHIKLEKDFLLHCPLVKEIAFTSADPSKQQTVSCTPELLAPLVEKYPGLDIGQLDQVYAGEKAGLTAEQIQLYADPKFTSEQMHALRYAVGDELSQEQLKLILNPVYSPIQIDILRGAFLDGLTMEQVAEFSHPELTPNEMLDAYHNIREGQHRSYPSDEDLYLRTAAREAEEDFQRINDHLEAGGNIADLADRYERDLDMEL